MGVRLCPACGRRVGGGLEVCLVCGADVRDDVVVREVHDPRLPPAPLRPGEVRLTRLQDGLRIAASSVLGLLALQWLVGAVAFLLLAIGAVVGSGTLVGTRGALGGGVALILALLAVTVVGTFAWSARGIAVEFRRVHGVVGAVASGLVAAAHLATLATGGGSLVTLPSVVLAASASLVTLLALVVLPVRTRPQPDW